MNILVTIIILALIGGIIYINRSSSNNIKTRDDFLAVLEKFLEGKREPYADYEDSHKIIFTFEGVDFTYEDVLIPGFKNEKVNKAYLKVKTNSSLTLVFEEKRKSVGTFRSDLSVFNKSGTSGGRSKLKVPDKLRNFEIHTDELEVVEKIFQNQKGVKILNNYKNVDSRGYPFMSIKIHQGLIILQFSSEKRYTPNLGTIRDNIHIFEDHLKDMINLKRIIEASP